MKQTGKINVKWRGSNMYVYLRDGKFTSAKLAGDLLDITDKLSENDKVILQRKALVRKALMEGRL